MNLSNLKVYILCASQEMYKCFVNEFRVEKNVFVCKGFFDEFMEENEGKIECIVSPANAFGYMTGGYDAAISDYFGWGFQNKVQQHIIDKYYGEQLVGTSFLIEDGRTGKKLIHTPTMRIPSRIVDSSIVYQCMRSTLMCAIENGVKSIVIPPFGGGCGEVEPAVIARNMKNAYTQILSKRRVSRF